MTDPDKPLTGEVLGPEEEGEHRSHEWQDGNTYIREEEGINQDGSRYYKRTEQTVGRIEVGGTGCVVGVVALLALVVGIIALIIWGVSALVGFIITNFIQIALALVAIFVVLKVWQRFDRGYW